MNAILCPAVLGMHAAAAKAHRLDCTWTDQALDDLRRYAMTAAPGWTIEQARAHCAPVPEGADLRAWGSVTQRAIRAGWIEPTGEYAPATSSHGAPKPRYRGRA